LLLVIWQERSGRETHLISLLQVKHPLESISARERLLRPTISVRRTHIQNIGSDSLSWSGAAVIRAIACSPKSTASSTILHPRQNLPVYTLELLQRV